MIFDLSNALFIVNMIAAGFFLVLAAIYDANGAEISDSVTVPYAAACIGVALSQQRYADAAIALIILVLVIANWKPKWFKKLNERFLRRVYESKEAHQEDSDALNEQADLFREKHGKTMDIIYKSGGIAAIAALCVSAVIATMDAVSEAGAMPIAVAWSAVLPLIIAFMLYGKHKESVVDDTVMREDISFFGGADIIVIAGIFAAHGPVSTVHGVAVSFLLHIIYVSAKRLIKHQPLRGGQDPLIPSLAVTAPARVAIAFFACQKLISEYNWLIRDIMENHFQFN